MARSKTTRLRRKAPSPMPALGPGLHAGWIELRGNGAFRVRTMTGERMSAVLGDDVDVALAEECLRASRLVILADTDRGPTILGALQTTRSLVREPDGTVSLKAKSIRLQVDESMVLEAGPVVLKLNADGTMRTEGNRMVIDMGSNVRVLSALVELP